MIRDVNIREHLPPFMREFRQMNEIMNANNVELQNAIDESEKLLNNQFIESTNQAGIEKFEKMLGLKPLDDDTLNNRQFKVLSFWNNSIPYSFRALKEKLNVLCGEDGYSISIDHENFIVDLKVKLTNKRNMDEVRRMVNLVIPCNMIVNITLMYNQYVTLEDFEHSELEPYTHYQLREEVL